MILRFTTVVGLLVSLTSALAAESVLPENLKLKVEAGDVVKMLPKSRPS